MTKLRRLLLVLWLAAAFVTYNVAERYASRGIDASLLQATRSLARQVNALADEVMQTALTRNPEIATFIGLPGMRHDRLTDNSLEAQARYQAEDDAFAARVLAIDPEPLIGRSEYVTLGFLREAAQSGAQGRVCRNELWAGVNQMFGWQVSLPRLAQVQPVGTPALRAQALARWGRLPRYVDNEIANLRRGLAAGKAASRKLSTL